MSEVCITLRKRQYSISRHTDYDFDRTTDMPLEKFCRCQKVLHDPRHLSRPPTGFTNFLPKPYQRPVAKMHKSVPCYTIQALAWLCKLITIVHHSSFMKKGAANYLNSFAAPLWLYSFKTLLPAFSYPH